MVVLAPTDHPRSVRNRRETEVLLAFLLVLPKKGLLSEDWFWSLHFCLVSVIVRQRVNCEAWKITRISVFFFLGETVWTSQPKTFFQHGVIILKFSFEIVKPRNKKSYCRVIYMIGQSRYIPSDSSTARGLAYCMENILRPNASGPKWQEYPKLNFRSIKSKEYNTYWSSS